MRTRSQAKRQRIQSSSSAESLDMNQIDPTKLTALNDDIMQIVQLKLERLSSDKIAPGPRQKLFDLCRSSSWKKHVDQAEIGIITPKLDVDICIILHKPIHDKMIYVDFGFKQMKDLIRQILRLEHVLGFFRYICIPEDCIRTCSRHECTTLDIHKSAMYSKSNKKLLPTNRLLSVTFRWSLARYKFGFYH